MKVLYQCAKIVKFTTQHKTIIRFGLIVLLFKRLNVFNLLAATKNLIINYTFFVNSVLTGVFIHSNLSCRANQRTGFFMIETSVMKEFKPTCFLINLRNKKVMTEF